MMKIKSLTKESILKIVDRKEIIAAVEKGFASMAEGKAIIPPVTNLDIEVNSGEVHIKSAYIDGFDAYCIKIASGFYNNFKLGLPTGYGLMQLFDVKTGFLKSIIFDEGLLTDLRTAAAGAVAAKYMSNEDASTVGVFGAGVQGKMQIEFLMEVRDIKTVKVFDRDNAVSKLYIDAMSQAYPDIEFVACMDPSLAVGSADIVVTATPSKSPMVFMKDINPGLHITAMGSDGPDKQEIDTGVLNKCDTIVVDHIKQCSELGEVHHGLVTGVIKSSDIFAELGELVKAGKNIRKSHDDITFCDLTGVAIQDLAISNWAFEKAESIGLCGELKL